MKPCFNDNRFSLIFLVWPFHTNVAAPLMLQGKLCGTLNIGHTQITHFLTLAVTQEMCQYEKVLTVKFCETQPRPRHLLTDTYSSSSDTTRPEEVEEEQGEDRSSSCAGIKMEQSVWSVVTEEVELSELLLSDWDTWQYSRTGQARSL